MAKYNNLNAHNNITQMSDLVGGRPIGAAWLTDANGVVYGPLEVEESAQLYQELVTTEGQAREDIRFIIGDACVFGNGVEFEETLEKERQVKVDGRKRAVALAAMMGTSDDEILSKGFDQDFVDAVHKQRLVTPDADSPDLSSILAALMGMPLGDEIS